MTSAPTVSSTFPHVLVEFISTFNASFFIYIFFFHERYFLSSYLSNKERQRGKDQNIAGALFNFHPRKIEIARVFKNLSGVFLLGSPDQEA